MSGSARLSYQLDKVQDRALSGYISKRPVEVSRRPVMPFNATSGKRILLAQISTSTAERQMARKLVPLFGPITLLFPSHGN